MKWKVVIIESERGMGQRIDEEKKFDNYEDAAAFVEKFNSRNTASVTPDWYMVANDPKPILP